MNTILLTTIIITTLVVLLSLLVQQIRRALLPDRVVSILVNHSRELPAHAGSKLLDALASENILLPSGCAGAGTCGLCKVTVSAGGGSVLATERGRLSDTECERGVRLACQLTVRDNLEITVAEEVFTAQHWNCTVTSSRYLSPLIKEITLELPADAEFHFDAGAYVQVTTPPFACKFSDFHVDDRYREQWQQMNLSRLSVQSKVAETRAYSIANDTQDKRHIVLLIRLALPPQSTDLPPGKVSSWLFSLQNNDQVEISGPFGDFTVHDHHRPMVLIGGGVGMAPLRAIIHQQIRDNTSQDIRFYYGARSLTDLFFQQEFDRLAQSNKHFTWTVALSEPAPNDQWSGERGFIHEIVRQQFIDGNPHADQYDYYLCGPPMMLKAAIAMLKQAGIDDAHIYSDNFEI